VTADAQRAAIVASSMNEACWIVSKPASIAAVMASGPSACAAVESPRSWAVSVAARSSSSAKTDARPPRFDWTVDPEIWSFTLSTPSFACSRTTRRISSASETSAARRVAGSIFMLDGHRSSGPPTVLMI